MAKLPRIFQNLFGTNGDQSHFGQFGSKVASSPLFTKDPSSIQALNAFINNGWLDATNPSNKAPFLEDMNGIFFLLFYQLCYMFQSGIPEWDTSTTYYIGSMVRAPGSAFIYTSLADNNTANALPSGLTSNAFWQSYTPQSESPGTITAFAGPSASVPAGKLLCDGTAYSQTSFPNLYSAIGGTWNTFNGNSSPGAGLFRVPDLRGVTIIGAGQGNGLTSRTLAQFLGEETHTLVTGEMPVHMHDGNFARDTGYFGNGYQIFGVRGIDGNGTSGPPNPGANSLLHTGNVDNAGGGGAHNNMQPSAGINYVVKT